MSDELNFDDITEALKGVEQAPSRMLEPGDVIGGGRFVVAEYIGKGAVGEVWRVHDSLLERDLAVKIVRIHDRVSPRERDELVARVLREANAARDAGDRCVHIVRIYDVASLASGDPFIVMEFLNGATLRQWLSACAPVEPHIAQKVGIQCAKALKALHSKGFIHRDIKPDNIFALDDDDDDPEVPFIRLIDFGLAKDLEAGKLTRTHTSIGTQRYMAPELFFAKGSTPLVDIFSIGVILFEALAGKNPMPIANDALIAAYHNGFESLTELCPQHPRWLTGLVDRCLALDPAERPDADQLLIELEDAGRSVQAGHSSLPLLPALDTTDGPELLDVPELPAEPELLDVPELLAVPELPAEPELLDEPELPALPWLPSGGPSSTPPPAEHGSSTQRGDTPTAEPASVMPVVAPSQPPTAALTFDDEPVQRYQLAHPAGRRSLTPVAIALFAGLAFIALAIVYIAPTTRTPTAPGTLAPASLPELAFKPRGPVNVDDFPAAPRSAPAPAVPSEAAVSKSAATAPASTAPKSSSTVAVAKAAPKSKAKRRPSKRGARPRPKRSAARKGLAKSFAELRDDALAKAGPASGAPPAVYEPVEYDDDAGAQFIRIGKPKPKEDAASLPAGLSLQASLVTGISSAAHDIVLARITKDVTVDGKVVLKAGDIVRGKSRNNFERIFIKFTQASRGKIRLRFTANAVTDGQPGLVATKRRIPKEDRSSNAVARGALTTAGDVAARLGSGGVASTLAGNVAREGVAEARPDFREREPFVLTVPKNTRFNIIVLGK